MTNWIYEIRGNSIYDTEQGRALSIFEAAERLNKYDEALDDIARGGSYPDMIADGALDGRITGLRSDTVISFTEQGT